LRAARDGLRAARAASSRAHQERGPGEGVDWVEGVAGPGEGEGKAEGGGEARCPEAEGALWLHRTPSSRTLSADPRLNVSSPCLNISLNG